MHEVINFYNFQFEVNILPYGMKFMDLAVLKTTTTTIITKHAGFCPGFLSDG